MGLTEYFAEKEKEEKAKEELLKEMRQKEAEKRLGTDGKIISEIAEDKSVWATKSHGDDETFAEHYGCKPAEPISEGDTFVDRILNEPVIKVDPKKDTDDDSDFPQITYGPNEPDIPEFSYPNFGCYNPAPPYYGVYGGSRIVSANARFMDTIACVEPDTNTPDKYKYYENKTRMNADWNKKHIDTLGSSWGSGFGGYTDSKRIPIPPRIKDRYAEWLDSRISKMYDKLTVRQLNLLNSVNVSSSKASIIKLIGTLQMLVAEGVFDEEFDVDAAIKADIEDYNNAT